MDMISRSNVSKNFFTSQYLLYFLLLALLPFILIGFYTEPIADDYAYAYRLLLKPYWHAYAYEYFTWNGRYTSNLFVLLNQLLIDQRFLYHLAPGVVILLLQTSVYFIIRTFLSKEYALRCSLLIVLLYLGSNARISEIMYWYTATVTYTLGTVFSLFAIGALIRLIRSQRLIWLLVGCVFIFLSSGTNEISMAINLFIAMVYTMKRYKRWPVVLSTSIVAALIVYFAPGNAVRTGFFPNAHNLIYSLGMSSLQTIRFSLLAVSYLALPVAVVVIWRDFNLKHLNISIINFVQKTSLLLIFICFLAPLFLSAFLPYYATGLLGQHRTMAFGQFYLLCFVIVLPLLVYVKFPTLYIVIQQRLKKVPLHIFIAAFVISYLFLGNSQKAWFETINGDLASQQNELLSREFQIRNAQKDEVMYFQPLDTTVLFVIDLGSNPEYWINKHQNTVLNTQHRIKTSVKH